MPENSQLKPSDINMITETTREVSNLAIMTVDLVVSGHIEMAKATAALCKEGRDLLKEAMTEMSPEDRQTVAKEVKRASFPGVQ